MSYRPWSEEEKAFLKKKWPFMFATDLSDEMGRSAESINYMAHKMCLVKDASFDPYSAYGKYVKKGKYAVY